MSLPKSKKRKVDSECRVFNEKWSYDYFCAPNKNNIVCLICNEKIAVFKEYNIRRHYDTKHKEKYSSYIGKLRKDKVDALKKNLSTQQGIFTKKITENVAATRASFNVAHLIAKCSKPFSDGEFVKKCMMKVVDEMCPEKKSVFETVSLSASTVTRRVEELGGHLFSQLIIRAQNFEYFSLALDESNDVVDISQLLIFIRAIDETFQVTEELATLHSLKGTTTGEDIYIKVCETLQALHLPWDKLKSVTTDGARNMTGTNTGLIGRVYQQMESVNAEKPLALHCIIHQQALCGKCLKFEHIMKVVVSTVNFIRSHGLNHRQFKTFLLEIEADYEDVIYHSDVRWLSRGKVLQRFFELRFEIEIFMNEKGHTLKELSDVTWIWELAIFTDITQHINDLNLKLQGKGKLICESFSDVKAFEAKLALFHTHLSQKNVFHFKSCDILQKDITFKETFPKEFALQAIESLQKEFNTRFQDFYKHSKDIHLFENPFSAVVQETPDTIQMELIDIQSNQILKDKYMEGNLIEFYKCLPRNQFPNITKFARSMITIFSSTYLCEQTFSRLKLNKSKLCSRLTDAHLHDILRIGVSNIEPDIDNLVSKKQSQVSH